MITDDVISEVGYTVKPHGINGELVAVVDPDIDLDRLRCLLVKVNGIPVPFFIGSWRSRGSESVLLKFDGIDNENAANQLSGCTLYADNDMLPESDGDDGNQGFYASDFIGWTVTDCGKTVGTVADYDDNTENLIFKLNTPGGSELLIPVADDLIVSIDPGHRILDMNLPTGLE